MAHEDTSPIIRNDDPDYQKSIRSLEKLERAGLLTEEGKIYVEQVLDPFCDDDRPPVDQPDHRKRRGIVQVVQRSISITKPPALAPGDFWDCHISTLPILNGVLTLPTNQQNNTLTVVAGAANIELATCNIVTVPNGDLTWAQGPNIAPYWVGATGQMQNLAPCGDASLPDSDPSRPRFADGPHRIVGMGFEVVNTTSELYKNGAVTMYEMPQAKTLDFMLTPNGTPTLFESLLMPPATQADALLFPNSITRSATTGAYMVSHPDAVENDVKKPSTNNLLVAQSRITGQQTAPTPVLYPDTPYPFAVHDWSIAGAYFVGLNENTSLQVTLKVYIARYPTAIETDLVVLTRPSPDYDPMAFQLLSEGLKKLPVGCRVNDNPLGEWFRKAVSSVGTLAQKVAPVISMVHPGAGRVAGLIGDVAGPARDSSSHAPPVGGKLKKKKQKHKA